LSQVTKTPEDSIYVRKDLEEWLKDKVGCTSDNILDGIAILGEPYYYAAEQEQTLDDELVEGFSNTGSFNKDGGGRDSMPIRDDPSIPGLRYPVSR